MKRSEMVDIMCEEFDRYVAEDYLESVNFLDAFDFILYRMEKEGMLPPECNRKMTEEELEDFNKIFAYKEDRLTKDDEISDFCWEPEEGDEE